MVEPATKVNCGSSLSLIELLRPKLATALQRATAIAVKATEEQAAMKWRDAIRELRNQHATDMEKASQDAIATLNRERRQAVEQAVKAAAEQNHDALRRELTMKAEKEKVLAVQAAVDLAMRQAERSQRQAVEAALAAAEKQAAAVLARAVQAAEERVATMWRGGVKNSERGHMEKLSAALARVEAVQLEAKQEREHMQQRINEAKGEASILRQQLTTMEHSVARLQMQLKEKDAKKGSDDKAMMDTLRAYERRAETEKKKAVMTATHEVKMQAEAAKQDAIARAEHELARRFKEERQYVVSQP